MEKLEILKTAIDARNDEIRDYQINIDNYTRAIAKIDNEYLDVPGLKEFRAQLSELLQSSKLEQLKTIIIRDVIAEQVSDLEES